MKLKIKTLVLDNQDKFVIVALEKLKQLMDIFDNIKNKKTQQLIQQAKEYYKL